MFLKITLSKNIILIKSKSLSEVRGWQITISGQAQSLIQGAQLRQNLPQEHQD